MKSQDTCEFFDNVQRNRLGEERMGFKIMMEELARERLTVGFLQCSSRRILDTIADRKRSF
jgi:acyl-CoA dehydrogenase